MSVLSEDTGITKYHGQAFSARMAAHLDLLNQTPIAQSPVAQIPIARTVGFFRSDRLPDNRSRTSIPQSIAFLSFYGVSIAVLLEAAWLAESIGARPEAVLLSSAKVSEDFYYRSLARHLGLAFIDADAFACKDVELADATRAPQSIRAGVVQTKFASAESLAWIFAPSGQRLDELLILQRRRTMPRARFAITTPTLLRDNVIKHDGKAIAERVAGDLPSWRPDLSAHARVTVVQMLILAAMTGLMFFAILQGGLLWLAFSLLAGSILSGAIVVRLFAAAGSCDAGTRKTTPIIGDSELPIFTIVTALYREAGVAASLVEALDALNYPALCSKSTKSLVPDSARFCHDYAWQNSRLSPH